MIKLNIDICYISRITISLTGNFDFGSQVFQIEKNFKTTGLILIKRYYLYLNNNLNLKEFKIELV